ncbi:MAG: hypothetical protein LC634_04790 [Sphingomonadales bacterium]|nr:hypothetical protein [Sphingomonadales bacterium]
MATDLSGVAGIYVFTPFFDADSARFIDRVERSCRPGTRICGLGLIAGQLRTRARMREQRNGRHRFDRAQLVLV